MPYIKHENKILTKVLGVAKADNSGNRQQILHQIKQGLVKVKFVYLNETEVHVVIDDPNGPKDVFMGNIKEEYKSILSNSKYLVNTYMVTGGHNINANNTLAKHGKTRLAYFGLNIGIKLFENIVA